ncbi:hypothetical protein Ctob_007314, partial [Chrysochromulina tobinii]
MASADWRPWFEKSASVWSRVMPENMIPFSVPILASIVADSMSRLFLSKLQCFNTALTFSASAITLAPTAPILVSSRRRVVKTAINFRSDPIRMASAGSRPWFEKSASVWSRVMPESMIPFSAPILAS